MPTKNEQNNRVTFTLVVGEKSGRLDGNFQRIENYRAGFLTYLHVDRLAAEEGEVAEVRPNG